MKDLKILWNGLLFSYTQVFFARQRWFALLLMAASFIDPVIGLGGLLAVITTNVFARVMGFNRNLIHDGIYAFNSLLVGLGIGVNFEINAAFFIILIFASILTFFVTVWLLGRLPAHGLPIGSLAFLLVSWIVILATRRFNEIELSERGIYLANELWKLGGEGLVRIYDIAASWPVNNSITVYLKSLGAIIFQYNVIAGLIMYFEMLVFLYSSPKVVILSNSLISHM